MGCLAIRGTKKKLPAYLCREMETIAELFGSGKELEVSQMVLRALVIFIIALVLVRFAGRRSFGMRMPFDNVIAMLLGSVLSRAVTGASPFLPTVAASVTIAVFYRLLAWSCLYSHLLGKLIKGESLILFREGKFIHRNMQKCLISEKDLLEAIRQNINDDSLDNIREIYAERDGKISILKKED